MRHYFYPRSPCGERHDGLIASANFCKFLSTLSLRRATRLPTALRTPHQRFLSTLSLRRATRFFGFVGCLILFLSTLSLRRATNPASITPTASRNFYPRSPCGERPYQQSKKQANQSISIHALLAESDPSTTRRLTNMIISIHALLAESDMGLDGRFKL